MHIYVVTMHFKHLFFGRFERSISYIYKKTFAIKGDAFCWNLRQIVSFDVIKQLFEERMKRVITLRILYMR